MVFDYQSLLTYTELSKRYNTAAEFFKDPEFIQYMQKYWPIFVARANDLCLQNGNLGQEVGKMRERTLLYLMYRFLGEDTERCDLDDRSISVNEKGKDMYLFTRPVSIKTISFGQNWNQLKISWVEDKALAEEIDRTWVPMFDLLLCRIKWGCSTEGIYYIYKETQREIVEECQVKLDITKTAKGYSKGTSLAAKVVSEFVTHSDTLKIPIAMPEEYRDENFLTRLFDHIYCEIDRGRYEERYVQTRRERKWDRQEENYQAVIAMDKLMMEA